ncbi:hypothetical protein EDEG_03322 [Edhazardia aedis USNM 41457]|uniref:Uncharacterized protein n=1 Tax=Edhazardia aedis (strain USNM 41457) TaxID=1003232 RepID=J8ZRB4_EDHAE|nr:hypothetical protein EDEG_03322 [Edhazardia aedis USNM 41457]|eukprot:EJW02238.1 hypothetical protein EDEG_03322 [Edhazardia aedis USNM 41457]
MGKTIFVIMIPICIIIGYVINVWLGSAKDAFSLLNGPKSTFDILKNNDALAAIMLKQYNSVLDKQKSSERIKRLIENTNSKALFDNDYTKKGKNHIKKTNINPNSYQNNKLKNLLQIQKKANKQRLMRGKITQRMQKMKAVREKIRMYGAKEKINRAKTNPYRRIGNNNGKKPLGKLNVKGFSTATRVAINVARSAAYTVASTTLRAVSSFFAWFAPWLSILLTIIEVAVFVVTTVI